MNDVKKYHDFEKEIKQVMKEDYQIFYTHSANETIQIVKNVKTPTRFYVVGGDGAINIIVQAIVHTEHELVVIPLGTGNDFCRTLTNEKNPITLLKQSLNCSSQLVDTILLNDTYYINAACFGLDSVIASHVHDTPHIPFVPESKSYIISILQNIFQYGFDDVIVEGDGKELYRGPVILCTINNAQYYGGGFCIIPHANIQDGYMDICIVEKIPKVKYPYMITLLLRHCLKKRKEVHYFQVKKAHIVSQNHCNMDGEVLISQDYSFEIVPKSLRLVIYDEKRLSN